MPKVLITGANGQVGWELQRTVPDGYELVAMDSAALDITQLQSVQLAVATHKPDWIINAAAYTAVDKAEEEPERAYAVNATGADYLARCAKQHGVKMIQISTDFVFDGAQSIPYKPENTPNPLSVYGKSKLEGEKCVQQQLGDDATIVRTSWVYSSHGNNFVKTMLRLMSERDELGIVSDQVGSPTWANDFSKAIWQMVNEGVSGLQHWSDYGVASWYDFSIAIYEEAIGAGLLNKQCEIYPIRTEQYKVLATRPHYSVLDKSTTVSLITISPQHWRVALRSMLADLKK